MGCWYKYFEGKHIANRIIGQVRNEEVNEERMIQYAGKIGANRDDFIDTLNDVPYMSAEQFGKVSKMLFAFAYELSEKGYNNLQLRKQIADGEEATRLLLQNEESLAILLNSIGDAVISTDKNGLIVNLNPVAEVFCGWTLKDEDGSPFPGSDHPVAQVIVTCSSVRNCYHVCL